VPLKLIVMDPVVTKIARMADIHLQLRPGTDTAVFMGWLNVIIREELYDKEFVARWTTGFERLAARAEEYPPERVARITGVPAGQIVASARLYATTKPASLYRGLATDQIGPNSARVSQARNAVRAITGNIDIPGGDLVPSVGPIVDGKWFIRDAQMELTERQTAGTRKLQLGQAKAPLMTWSGYELTNTPWQKLHGVSQTTMHRLGCYLPSLYDAILEGQPYPVKALITWGSNPLMWGPNITRMAGVLKDPNLELHVVQEYWMTPTAQLADYVLPAASWLERPMCSTQEDFTDVVWGGSGRYRPWAKGKTITPSSATSRWRRARRPLTGPGKRWRTSSPTGSSPWASPTQSSPGRAIYSARGSIKNTKKKVSPRRPGSWSSPAPSWRSSAGTPCLITKSRRSRR
jgi:anaerobic selenocysteine-containing dehydrogenase